ncbi:efflux transporter outer membrane subunit [Salinisphaera hydrothermalis]|uniref:efflux transporter outer membrane subunit n=1 Tax=Salinisphaera hydrothermalis TaxID=563188 RepID=UPI0033415E0B
MDELSLFYWRRVALIIGALTVAGCSLAPAERMPVPPIPPRYDAGAANAPEPALDAARVGWRDFFRDPRLQRLIEAALAHNRDLQVAVSRVDEVRAQYRIQRASELPRIDASGTVIRGDVPGNTPLIGGDDIKQHQLAILVPSYELDFWGRVANLRRAALAEYLATDEARRSFEISLIAQVADTYLLQRELDERIALATQTLRNREESLRIARRRYELGATSELALRQMQTLTGSTRADLAALHQDSDRNRHLMQQLVGEWPGALPPPRSLAGQGVVTTLGPGLPSDLLLNRPDLRADEARLRGANANIGAARAAFLPQITLTASYGTASAQLKDLFAAGTSSWLFVPRLTVPLFDYGERRANLDLAWARRHTVVAQYESDVQQAFREVRDGLTARKWLRLQVEALRYTVAAERARVRLARHQYDNGSVAFIEVLDAQRALFTEQQRLVQMRRAELTNAVDLYRALGGGRVERRLPTGANT